jgi:predicted MPP superfamily phosphohydrolase
VLLRVLVALFAGGVCCVAYGVFVERHWYRRAHYGLPLLPAGAPGAITVLHLSDLHFVDSDRRKERFLAALPQPDIVAVTGDFLAEPEGVEAAVLALRPLRGRLASYFVLGSNDYFAPRPLNYLAYFSKRRRPRKAIPGRSADLIAQLEDDGWTYLKNRSTTLSTDGVRLEVTGLDDPHIERHDLRAARRHDPEAIGLAVVHSPDPAPELAAMGYALIVAGHTHGGQVRFPFVGALVTNGTIPRKLCMGLSRLGPALLHVSPGIGTSKYAPFRFLCRPEATVLRLEAPQEAEPATRRKTSS